MQKVAIITGAGRGMGAATAKELHNRGYEIAAMSPSGAQELSKFGALTLAGSVTNPDDLAKLVKLSMERFGRIDAVVNSTGHAPKGDLLEISDESWHEGMDLLLLNVVRITKLVTPIFLKQGGGAIVNISTYAAFEPSLKFPVSSSLRAALGSFTKLYADRYAADRIRMNNILPGYIESYPGEPSKDIPMQRAGKLDEVAKTIAFLLSEDAGYITGQNVRIDGGLTRSV